MALTAAAFALSPAVSLAQAPAAAPVAAPAFPELPPSRVCKVGDLKGIWRWSRVYETAPGAATAAYVSAPFQYIAFGENNDRFVQYVVPKAQTNRDVLRNVSKIRGTEQYIFHDSGFIFFYKDGALIDTMACFIAMQRKDPFMAGDMLLMPPAKEGVSDRMVKSYQKLNFPKKKRPKRVLKRKR